MGGPLARKTAIAAAFLLLLALVAKPVWEGREQWHWGQGMDDGIYWVTAKALADGAGYRAVSLPGQPYEIKFPPLGPGRQVGGTKCRLLAREPPLTIAPTHADNRGDANTAGPVIS